MAAYTTIDDPSAYFKVQLYTGNVAANHAITFDDTDTDMQPDFVWIKNRDATDAHCFFDSVRGATKLLTPEATVEVTDTDTLDSFTSDGFQVDADVKVNTDAEKYVSWNWKAGTTSGIDATGADITPGSYSFNQTSGFSIIAYTGNGTDDSQVPHGLGAVAHLVMTSARNTPSESQATYHHKNSASPAGQFLELGETNASRSGSTRWSDTIPTSVLFTLGDSFSVNKSAGTVVAYCFTEKQGFSKFGGYEGNGNADGTFVYTGFRPAFVWTKSVDSTSAWHMFDNKREGYNVDNDPLVADTTTVEATTDMIDLLSNGFKFRIATDPNVAETYVYAAFAEAPFVNSNGVPCNAR